MDKKDLDQIRQIRQQASNVDKGQIYTPPYTDFLAECSHVILYFVFHIYLVKLLEQLQHGLLLEYGA